MDKKFYTKTDLTGRNWTESLVRRFMPEPDKTYPNPRYRNAAPVKLYASERVEDIERTEAFREAMEKRTARKEAATKAVKTKKERIAEWVRGLTIEIPDFDKEILIEEACRHFNAKKKYEKERYEEWAYLHYEEARMNWESGLEPDFSPASPNSEDKPFLARITTNYLRHQCTPYEGQLERMFGKTGKQEGHDLLKQRINEAILAKFPWLAASTTTEADGVKDERKC